MSDYTSQIAGFYCEDFNLEFGALRNIKICDISHHVVFCLLQGFLMPVDCCDGTFANKPERLSIVGVSNTKVP